MALERKVIPIRLDTGVDLSSDPHSGVGLTRCENARFERNGAVSKRYGWIGLNGATSEFYSSPEYTYPMFSDTFGSTVFHRSANADCQNVGLNSTAYMDAVRILPVVMNPEYIDLPIPGYVYPELDICEAGGYFGIIYRNSTDIMVAHVNAETGALLETKVVHSTTFGNAGPLRGRIIKGRTGSTDTLRFYYTSLSNELHHGHILTAGGAITDVGVTTGSTSTLVHTTYKQFDVCRIEPTGQQPHVIIVGTDTNGDLFIRSYSRGDGATTPAYDSTIARTGGRTVVRSTCFPLGEYVLIAFVEWDGATSAYLRVVVKSYDGTTIYGPNSIGGAITVGNVNDILSVCGQQHSNGQSVVFVSIGELVANEGDFVNRYFLGATATLTSTLTFLRRRVATKPFPFVTDDMLSLTYKEAVNYYSESYGNTIPTMCDYFTDCQHFFWLTGTSGTIGRHYPGRARTCFSAGFGTTASAVSEERGKRFLPQVFTYTDAWGETWTAFGLVTVTKETVGDDDRFSLNLVRFSQEKTHKSQSVWTGRSGLIGASCPYEFDGAYFVEQGFLQYPERITATAVAGANLTSGAVYNYLAVYEWADSSGQIHRSFPGTAAQVTPSGGNLSVDISLPCTSFTAKDISIAVYRTVGNGSIFYRIGSTSNNPEAARVTYSDSSVTDTTILTMEQLYTQSGQIGFLPPQPYLITALWDSRQWIVDIERPYLLRYSHKEVQGEPVCHAGEIFTLRVGSGGDAVTALYPFMDKLLIWTKSALYVTEGRGPGPDGGGSDYVSPYLISPSTGCINYKSVLRLPDGIAFQASDGLWLVRNDLSVTKFGDPVTHFFTQQEAYIDTSLGTNTTTKVYAKDIEKRVAIGTYVTFYDTTNSTTLSDRRKILSYGLNFVSWGTALGYTPTTGYKIKWTDEVVGSGVSPQTHRAIWVLRSKHVVYDYVYKKWTTYTSFYSDSENPSAIDSSITATCVDGKISRVINKSFSSTYDGVVALEDFNKYNRDDISDQDGHIKLVLETGWISLSGPLAEQRIYEFIIAGYNLQNHILRIKFGYDYSTVWTDSLTFDMSDNTLGTMPDEFGFYNYSDGGYLNSENGFIIRAVPTLGKCHAIRVHISDEVISTDDYRESLTITNAAFVVGTKPGRGALTTPGRYK